MTSFQIIQIDRTRLVEYKSISISFEVRSIYDITEDNQLIEKPVEKSYIKDYDQIESPSWSEFNTDSWGIFLAIDDNRPVGGAIVSMPECELIDIRIAPSYRRLGIGRALFEHAIQWAKQKQQGFARRMSIETQNTNVSACQFYMAMGAKLGDIDRNAYRNEEIVKDEIRLNFYIDLE